MGVSSMMMSSSEPRLVLVLSKRLPASRLVLCRSSTTRTVGFSTFAAWLQRYNFLGCYTNIYAGIFQKSP